MGTNTLYLRSRLARQPYPESRSYDAPVRYSMYLDCLEGQTFYNKYDYCEGHDYFIPFLMEKNPGTSSHTHYATLGVSSALTQLTWIHTWQSPSIKNPVVTFSSANTSFSFHMGAYTDVPIFYPAEPPLEDGTYDNTLMLDLYVYHTNGDRSLLWRGFPGPYTWSSGMWGDHTLSYVPIPNTLTNKTWFSNKVITGTATASAGDRLAIDVYYYMPYSPAGFRRFAVALDGTNIDIDKSRFEIHNGTFTLTISDIVGTSFGDKYNIFKELYHDVPTHFDMLGLISNSVSPRYHIRRGNEYFYNLETLSALRGRYSLKVGPDVNFPTASNELISFVKSQSFLENRWEEKMASFHKFIMLEDFEGIESKGDVGMDGAVMVEDSDALPSPLGGVTYLEGASLFDITHAYDDEPYLTYEYYFESSTDLTDYNVLSILGRGSIPTVMDVYVRDYENNTSIPKSLFINDRFGRYETELSFDGVDKTDILSIGITNRFAGDVILDDLTLLSALEYNRGFDWIIVNMTKYSYTRQGKTNTIKIPYGGGEFVQNLGDYNAKGVMSIRTFDNSDALFLNTVENEKIPIYARFKNTGLPIFVNRHDITYKNYSNKNIQTQIDIDFTEIYGKRI